jgi:hypothetical protein
MQTHDPLNGFLGKCRTGDLVNSEHSFVSHWPKSEMQMNKETTNWQPKRKLINIFQTSTILDSDGFMGRLSTTISGPHFN